jgi:Rrf2 family protein
VKYSQATNYALHTMLHLVASSPRQPIGVQHLAEIQNLSPTYLSKILTKLVKAGLIESISGANGGYRLKKKRDDLSFMDVIQAIEGTTSLFDCYLEHQQQGCLIQEVMVEAERQMEQSLREKKLVDLAEKMRPYHTLHEEIR